MKTTTDNIIKFFDQVKTITIWQRLFNWGKFRSLSYDAYEEFKELLSEISTSTLELDSARGDISVLKNDKEHIQNSIISLDNENKNLKEKLNENNLKISELSKFLATKEEALRQANDRLKEFEIEISTYKEKTNINSVKIQELTSQIATKNEVIHQNRDTEIKLERELISLKEKNASIIDKISDLTTDRATKDETLKQLEEKAKRLEVDSAASKEKIINLHQENTELKQENTILNQTEIDRKTHYEKNVASLNSIREQIQLDRRNEVEKFHQLEIDQLKKLKETWANHEKDVMNAIKLICDKHTIEYVDKVPFKGNPDNTIKICEEFVIFDAKSPATDDLDNFSSYIKLQTESVKKYAKEENVKKEIFLVIPSNTVDVVNQFSHNMADYTVYVVTIDALEPIILSLKKLEEYEFVKELSPEERDNICRVIGKFAHMTKRRIQIDIFFQRQFLEILSKCESELPYDIKEKVLEYERSEKLNPPQEKRAKLISTKELESDSQKILKEAEAKAIYFSPSIQQEIKSLPLDIDEETINKEEES